MPSDVAPARNSTSVTVPSESAAVAASGTLVPGAPTPGAGLAS